jgi:hypothetical protein
MEREKWIDEILQSAKQIESIESNPYLPTRIEARLQQPVASSKIKLSYAVAALSLLLVILLVNVAVWRGSIAGLKQNNSIENLVKEYGWNITDFYSSTNQK